MKGKKLTALLAAVALMQCAPAALANNISFEGKVTSEDTCQVYADIGGTVLSVDVKPGEAVNAGDAIATLKTTKVYAEESGIVSGVFAQPGDNTQTIAGKYGAVLYIDPESEYTISASIENAYDSADAKFVHPGEKVYLSCYSDDGDHEGEGRVTSVSGKDYIVEVTEGEFIVGERVNIYRTERHKSSSRIGRGELTRTTPTAVTGTGSIVSLAVADGDEVERGDLLFETVDGSFDGLYMSGCAITAPVDGYVASISAQAGAQATEGTPIAEMYPKASMRIEAEVSESDLGSIAVGDPVSIELNWNRDDDVRYEGVVTMISAIASADASGDEATYTVYIDFTPDEHTRYGMNATISTMDGADDGEADSGEAEADEDEQQG